MEILVWTLILIVALVFLVSGGEIFLNNAEKIGIRLGLSSFVIGALIVGVGTSFPELASSIVAVLQGVPEIVTSNAIGSNIANILVIGGALAFVGKRLTIDKDLLEAELPFFVISTALFAGVVFDGRIVFTEAVLLAATFVVYLIYLLSEDYESGMVVADVKQKVEHERFSFFRPSELRTMGFLVLGLAMLLGGAHYVVSSVVALAELLSVPTTAITITTIALGTSLPELVVSVKALKNSKIDVAVGNIFGSNAFNILMAVGIPGLFTQLPLDTITLKLGFPIFLMASFIFLITGLARKLFRWEGIMFFLIYVFFMMQLWEMCCAA